MPPLRVNDDHHYGTLGENSFYILLFFIFSNRLNKKSSPLCTSVITCVGSAFIRRFSFSVAMIRSGRNCHDEPELSEHPVDPPTTDIAAGANPERRRHDETPPHCFDRMQNHEE